MTADEKFEALGLTLPPAPKPKGVYKPILVLGKEAYVSGHGPVRTDGTLIMGKVGSDLTIEEGKLAAQQVGLTILSTLKANLGSLDKIDRVVKILGMVNGAPDFGQHPFVINGCSELFAAIWGEEKGIGVRSAVGMGTLPEDISVEIEVLFHLKG
ncbi:Enamine deaminase RidA, house cleaning of reactive enamine intermediates, YjgF/YER057c/UK114 family [Spirosomataceae bacterium TFI 002]|nr:Enamine deaminase RidA, house cleaning of reactive enamine intermediates, YjgF/YER057c/UK114 family [Spirosomataceae bacterium TFI 002]